VCPERASEHALDDRLDPMLDAPQDAHGRGALCPPGTLTTPEYRALNDGR